MWCCNRVEPDTKTEDPHPVMRARKCTDLPCLFVFIIFIFGMVFIACFSLVYGNPMRLVYGYDSFGNTCGRNNADMADMNTYTDMSDRRYLFFMDMKHLRNSIKVCVKQCPTRDLLTNKDLQQFGRETGSLLCRYDMPLDMYDRSSSGNTPYGPCPPLPVPKSAPLFNRCVPESFSTYGPEVAYNFHAYLNNIDVLQQVFADLYVTWPLILSLIFMSTVLSFGLVCIIYVFAQFVSWIIMAIASVASIGVTCLLWSVYIDDKMKLDQTPDSEQLDKIANNESVFFVYAIISTVFTVLLLILVMFLCRRVELVVALFKEASACIRAMPCLLMQPVWSFLALTFFFLYWVAVLVALATADHPTKQNIPSDFEHALKLSDPKLAAVLAQPGPTEGLNLSETLHLRHALIEYVDPAWVKYMWWYYVIALIWVSEFVMAAQQMVIAGSVASWYFIRNKDELNCPVFKSFCRIFPHTGSLALGSFLITMFKVPRLILTYFVSRFKDSEGTVAKWILTACTCCLYLMEKCIRFLNHNAYTIIAINGYNFCPAARAAFTTIMTHADKVLVINSVGDFILFLGKCSVAALISCAGIIIMQHDERLNFWAIPILIVGLFSYFIANCVLSVYEMVVDTLFLCFCEDMSRNDGSPGKEYFAPPSLLEYLSKQKSPIHKNRAALTSATPYQQEQELAELQPLEEGKVGGGGDVVDHPAEVEEKGCADVNGLEDVHVVSNGGSNGEANGLRV